MNFTKGNFCKISTLKPMMFIRGMLPGRTEQASWLTRILFSSSAHVIASLPNCFPRLASHPQLFIFSSLILAGAYLASRSTHCQAEKDVCVLLCISEYDNSQIIYFCLQINPLYLLSSDLCLRFLQLSILMAQVPKNKQLPFVGDLDSL